MSKVWSLAGSRVLLRNSKRVGPTRVVPTIASQLDEILRLSAMSTAVLSELAVVRDQANAALVSALFGSGHVNLLPSECQPSKSLRLCCSEHEGTKDRYRAGDRYMR